MISSRIKRHVTSDHRRTRSAANGDKDANNKTEGVGEDGVGLKDGRERKL